MKAKLTPWLRIIGGLLIIYGILEAIYVIRNGLYHYVIISLVCWVISWRLIRKKEGKNEH